MQVTRTLSLLLGISLFCSTAVLAGNGHSKRNVDDNDTVAVHGNVPPQGEARHDRGPSNRNLEYEKMILLLQPRANIKDTIEHLVAQLNDPKSPSYHQWLTPAEFGKRFGITDDDLSDITDWLKSHGFTIDEIPPGRGWVNFSGSVSDVERAFHTSIHDFDIDGKQYHGNVKDPEIPRALADVVSGVVTLHNFPKKAMNHGFKPVPIPEFTSGTSHFVSPADFATIYNVNPLYSAGINGTGKTIAIVGRTDIALADVQFFRSFFGLVANDPVFVHNGTDPGNLGGGEEGEADLDVEWSGAVAPNATVKFVISKSTATTDGVDLSAQFIVNNNTGDVMSTSFGQCESSMGTTENAFYNNLWSQAATQGITSFVSSGDSGAAGCNGGSDTTGSGAAVSGIASTPFNVAVGGTQFNDTAAPSTWWNATNASNQSSARSYIPEIAWNESGNVAGGSGLWSSSGGMSTVYAKPSWQVCVGVPATNARFVPDISLTAAGHDGYLVIQGHTATVSGLGAVGGTSASSPSFAGLMALVVQKTGQRWGNANTKFYTLANAQYASGGTVMFHDITSGNNSVPGVTGFSCGTGYDAVTGVGTVDATAFVNNFSGGATPDFTIAAAPSSVSIVQGTSAPSTITTTVSGGFNNAISLSATGAPSGTTAAFSPTSIPAPGSGSSTMTITVGAATATGTYTITVTGTGGTATHTTTVSLTVTPSGGGGGSELIVDGGFEQATASGNSAPGWSATPSPTGRNLIIKGGSFPHAGTAYAELGGGTNQTDVLTQSLTIPANATAASLTFWTNIVTQESGSTAFDFLTVNIISTTTTTKLSLNNSNSTSSSNTNGVYFKPAAIDLLSYKGLTITVQFKATTDVSLPTTFRIDDVSLQVTTGAADTTAPTTSVTTPANNATVSGTINVTATASDNVGVTKMEIYIDGALKTSNTNLTSLTFSWNTTTATNGAHTITSKAYDAANNIGTSAAVNVTVSNVGPQQLLGNPGFENGSTNTAPWTTTTGVVDNSAGEAAHSGTWKAWMNGYGAAHTDTIVQTVTIPASVTTATLTFWLHIDTAETTTTTAFDTLQVQIRNSSGTVLSTLATFSNLNKNTGFAQKSFDVSTFKGQTIQVFMIGVEDTSAQTSFVVDDFALNVQ